VPETVESSEQELREALTKNRPIDNQVKIRKDTNGIYFKGKIKKTRIMIC